MDSEAKQTSSGGGYGYSANYAGYSASGYGYEDTTSQAHRTIKDYVLILRERIWYVVVVFLVIFSSVLVYTFSRTKLYESVASVQIFRRDPTVMQVQAVMDNDIRSAEDLNTQVKILESAAIIKNVADRLTGDDLRRFMAPYEKGDSSDPILPTQIIGNNRKIIPLRLSLVLQVSYEHPDPAIAAKVANLFMDEFITYNARIRIDESMKAVEDLHSRADDQRKKVDELSSKLQNYRERNNLVSLDQRKDIVTEKLKALNLYLTQSSANKRDAEIRWQQVKDRRSTGGDLTELPFIANQPLIATLKQQLSAQKIGLSQMSERYRNKHPKMIEAENSLKQTERELIRAVNSSAAAVESEYQNAISNEQEARSALAKQEAESMELDRYAVEYSNLERDFKINEQILENILARARETSMTSTIETQNARVIDRAAPAIEPSSPKVVLNLALGFVGGIGMGLAFAFFVAFIDDRVKSSFDIEGVVGLPLLGIIPQIRKMDLSDKAQIVVNNADRQVSEAFLTLHSSLRLHDESKNAKCILITSTIPGEGKSFTITNLALTFAAHGEKVVLVDCDLRKPSIHKGLRLENSRGVIDICTKEASLDDVILHNVTPNLDVIPAGGRAKNPTHLLNSKGFESMIAELRKRYDRVLLDTPPLAAVSDALIILPMADGSLFNIYFNKVRRKAAQFAAKRLQESNVPIFGAILNGLNVAVSGYYYAQYYDKSYKDYYVVQPTDEKTRA
ncbi:MAG: polysaccharide biosynthesis tyrosine autokinase [Cephaloticoccus sp.]|nr:polysaccharide biosynthesis tyrosine autokinase [Cephaloticoccus sp.]MCF7761013.1 polysaccharide biosynthesis tyrosine autokinase [Cephaloticoccus sp.]